MANPMVNYANIIKETTSNHYNVRDEYKNNTVEENVEICKADRLPFSVGVVNVTGDLNVGMMIRSASLLGAENFYIFGRKKFDKRSTVGAEKYINIVQYVFDDPIHSDEDILHQIRLLNHDVVACELGGVTLGTQECSALYDELQSPLFLFGSESHGVPDIITKEVKTISIPQLGVLRSFNVSAAMNIIVWDYLKEMYL